MQGVVHERTIVAHLEAIIEYKHSTHVTNGAGTASAESEALRHADGQGIADGYDVHLVSYVANVILVKVPLQRVGD